MCNNRNCQKNISEDERTKIKGSGAVFLTHVKGILCVVLGLEAYGERKGSYSLPCGKYETKDLGCPYNTAKREIYEEMNCDFNIHFSAMTESRLSWVDSNAYNLLYIYIHDVYHGMFNSTNEMLRIAYVPIHSVVSNANSTQVATVTYGKLVPGRNVYGHSVRISKFAQCVIMGMYNRGELKMFGIESNKSINSR
jgi:ferredoxin-thioredoxin reductase catalytic subunit